MPISMPESVWALEGEVLYTPPSYLFTPHFLSSPKNKLFAPHSIIYFPPLPSLHHHSPKTHPPQSYRKTHRPQIREPPNNKKFGDSTQDQKYQVSLLLYLIYCVYSCIFILKYGFIVDFFFEISSGFHVSGFYVLGFSNPNLSFCSGLH